jgi:hypothetical protein
MAKKHLLKAILLHFAIAVLFLSGNFSFAKTKSSIYSVYLKQINTAALPQLPVDIVVLDDKFYVLCSSSDNAALLTYYTDLRNLSNPNRFNLDGNATSVAFNSSYAYVSHSDGSIDIVNFKNINEPKKVSTIDAFGQIVKMTMNNGFLFYIRKDYGLNVYDVTIPDFPVYKGNQLVSGDANGLYVRNNYAYVTSSNASLSIIDISDISKLPVVGNYNFGVSFYDIYVKDNYAYIPQGTTGVQVINVSKLPSPQWVANIFSRKFSKQVVVSGYYTWVNDDNSIQAFYNKDPKNQLWAGSFDNGSRSINKIEIYDGKYIYLCSSDAVLKVLQIEYNY